MTTNEKKHQGFRKTEDNGGVRDPNIRTGPRETKKLTKRAIKERELLSILRKVKPHLSDAIMTAATIMHNKDASHVNQLKAAVILLDAYRELTNDIYSGKDVDENEEGQEVQPQNQGAVVSFKVIND